MTDEKLKQALAKMLPEQVSYEVDLDGLPDGLFWKTTGADVLDTELLHLCALVARNMPQDEQQEYTRELRKIVADMPESKYRSNDSGLLLDVYFYEATWQQRATALAKVKGIEV